MPTYERLSKTHHHHYEPEYWRRIRALYAGGELLLRDRKLLQAILPRHGAEEDWVYEERCQRAFYIPYLGQLIDFISAALGADPVGVDSDPTAHDEFYDRFFLDTSKPGGQRLPMNQLLRQQVLTALLCRRAWTLVDLPSVEKDDPEPKSRFEEEALGRLDAYVLPLAPEAVIDWERDSAGELEWALVCNVLKRRPNIEHGRHHVREEYTVYDRESWKRYVVEWDTEKGKPPADTDEIPLDATGKHSFGRVPLVGMRLPHGLWAGNKLESIAREHFNKRCALSWGQYKSLFQILVATLEPSDPTKPLSEDQDRAVNQTIGPGRVWVGSDKDRLSYVGPSAEPFKVSMEDLATLRDEMFRVVHQMALSVDNSGAALQRSAASKQVDQGSTAVVLRDLGRRAREHCQDIMEMVARGRGEPAIKWHAKGMDQFDEVSMDAFVNEAVAIETVSIPSPTFQKLYKFELARRLIPGATDEQLADIQDELEEGISAEDLAAKAGIDALGGAGADPLDDPPPPAEPQPPAAPAPKKRTPKKPSKK